MPASRITSLEIHGDSVRHASSASYTLRRMTPEESNLFDLDDGVLFKAEDLVGKNGAGVPKRRMAVPVANSGVFGARACRQKGSAGVPWGKQRGEKQTAEE